ncbi:MAG: hypothetical protein E7490_02870 [Ruminococcaceae bacterium]|nr:hypothetical protein [Oscillospiraceae bacterium]
MGKRILNETHNGFSREIYYREKLLCGQRQYSVIKTVKSDLDSCVEDCVFDNEDLAYAKYLEWSDTPLFDEHFIACRINLIDGPFNRHGNIRCEGCGSYNMECCVGWDGCDDECEAGEGSGFDCIVSLDCNDCGRVYPIIRLKSDYHVGKECYSFLKENKENGKD